MVKNGLALIVNLATGNAEAKKQFMGAGAHTVVASCIKIMAVARM